MYPGSSIGQMYIPAVNLILWLACSLVVVTFRTSHHMEAAYGLSITVTMLMTTALLYFYLIQNGYSKMVCTYCDFLFGVIEIVFFISSIVKILPWRLCCSLDRISNFSGHVYLGAWNIIRESVAEDVALKEYIPQLAKLRDDRSLPLYQTNIVLLVPDMAEGKVGRQFVYSILDKRPKRARVYWFVHVEVTDEPYTKRISDRHDGYGFLLYKSTYS